MTGSRRETVRWASAPESGRRVDYLIATHVADAYGPQYVLRDYLSRQGVRLAYVACPFDYASIPQAVAEVYVGGVKQEAIRGHRNTARGAWAWLRDAWFVWRSGWRLLHRRSTFIGINNLNTAVGVLLKWLGRGGTVVYYVIDYTPRRFSAYWLNAIYQQVARFAARHADVIWNLSERMQRVHIDFGAREAANRIVPIGVHAEEAVVLPEEAIDRRQLVIVSTLFESKGVQLCLDALAYLPEARLVVIGTGPYGPALQQRAQALGVADRVEFLGLTDRATLVARLSASRAALAPYQTDPANYSYYADPAKPKEYLACGVPVIITRVPWIAEEIDRRPMGLVIDDEARALAAAAERLMTDDDLWRRCRQEAVAFSRGLDWNAIFRKALDDLAPARH